MAKIVGGFLMPHEPGVLRIAQPWSEAQQQVMGAYTAIARRIAELQADTVIVVGSDHYVLFGPQCLPSCLIGIGDVSGPYERFEGMEQGPMRTNSALAQHIAEYGRNNGVDWAVSKHITVDHSIGIPARLCALPNAGVSVVPVYLASAVEPLVPKRRAHQIGQAIRAAVESWSEDARVVVIGSGGISHWVGLPEMGQVNPEFDRRVIDAVSANDAEALIGLDDAQILAEAGNGALEIRNFLCALGAVGRGQHRVLHYANGAEWVTGLGFMELEVGHVG
jgi:protocatechuate 4,5-dioxygenase beta chain